MKYRHLSQWERYQIAFFKSWHFSCAEIAGELARSPSTISRELKRGCGHKGYRPLQAQRLALDRALGSRNARFVAPDLWPKVEALLEIEHSPEQIASALPMCIMSIYRYVAHNRQAGGQLYKKLRCKKARRRRYAKGYGGQGQIVNRVDISQRPAHIGKRRTVGHWEIDTVVGSQGQGKSVLVSMVERKSGALHLRLSPDRSAAQVSRVVIDALKPLAARVLSITTDNGHEFAMHEKIDAALQCKSYFAKPYASYQRGTVENLNGLIRQYFPKGTNFDHITPEQVALVEHRLNTRPRKRLHFRTPKYVFNKSFNRVALRK